MADGSDSDGKGGQGPLALGEVMNSLALQPRRMTAVQKRLLSTPLSDEDAGGILYQHSVLCQTCLPYRDPGADVRDWTQSNGFVSLKIVAGSAYGSGGQWIDVGLPFGPKPRLVFYYLNAEAMRTQSRVLDLEDSLTAFVRRTLGLDGHGRNIRVVKDQLARMSAADFRFGFTRDGKPTTIKGGVIEGFQLWEPKDARQRVLWPTTVQFSQLYFETLLRHAVPLSESAVMRIAHNAMALDIYTWMAQRLHRIERDRPQLAPWVSLKQQFGDGYRRMVDFRRVFCKTLRMVKVVYPEAQYQTDDAGMRLAHSKPPVAKRVEFINAG